MNNNKECPGMFNSGFYCNNCYCNNGCARDKENMNINHYRISADERLRIKNALSNGIFATDEGDFALTGGGDILFKQHRNTEYGSFSAGNCGDSATEEDIKYLLSKLPSYRGVFATGVPDTCCWNRNQKNDCGWDGSCKSCGYFSDVAKRVINEQKETIMPCTGPDRVDDSIVEIAYRNVLKVLRDNHEVFFVHDDKKHPLIGMEEHRRKVLGDLKTSIRAVLQQEADENW